MKSGRRRASQMGVLEVHGMEEWHPEIVLLDLIMPGMDGFEVAARLRADLTGTKIVAVTALPQDDARVQDAGFDRYLVKPVLKDTVSQVIRQLTP